MDTLVVRVRDRMTRPYKHRVWSRVYDTLLRPVTIAVYNRVGAQVQAPIWEKAP